MTTTLSGTTLTFNDGSTQTTTTNSFAPGVGQSWTNVTSSRALATTYTNSTGRPIMVSIYNNFSPSNALVLTIGSTGTLDLGFNGSYGAPGLVAIIPTGSTYSLPYTYWSFAGWWELR